MSRLLASRHLLDPGRDRKDMRVPDGATLQQMVTMAWPDLPEGMHCQVRATIDGNPILSEYWHRVRPKSHTVVHITLVPADSTALRGGLLLGVTIAALLVSPYLGPVFAEGGALGISGLSVNTATGLAAFGIIAAGSIATDFLQTKEECP